MPDPYKYGVAVHLYKPIIKRGVVDFAVGADWTPAAGDVKISKDGGAAANVTNLPTAIAMGNTAMWDYSLTATEMQAKQIRITVADSATKAVEDTMFEIDTYGNASAMHAADLNDSVRLGLTALPNAAAEAAGGLYTRGAGAGQIAQSNNGRVDSDVKSIANAAIAAATFAANALDAVWSTAVRVLTAGTNIVLAKGVGVTGLNDLDAAGVRGAVGLGAANLDTQLSAIAGFIDTEIADIRNRLPAALVGGRMDSNLSAVSNDTVAIANFLRSLLAIARGTVSAGATTTSLPTSSILPAAARIDQFKGRVVIFDANTTTVNLRGQATDITANTAGGTLTVTALTDAPANGDTFVIL